jgi:hypothetical protein
MSPTELKMQPTIHLERKTGFYRVQIQLYVPNVLWVAFSVGLIITRESPSRYNRAKALTSRVIVIFLLVWQKKCAQRLLQMRIFFTLN